MKSPSEILQSLKACCEADRGLWADLNESFLFQVTGIGDWVLSFKKGPELEAGNRQADATLMISPDDLAKLFAGEENGQALVVEGRMNLEGDPQALLRLSMLIEEVIEKS